MLLNSQRTASSFGLALKSPEAVAEHGCLMQRAALTGTFRASCSQTTADTHQQCWKLYRADFVMGTACASCVSCWCMITVAMTQAAVSSDELPAAQDGNDRAVSLAGPVPGQC